MYRPFASDGISGKYLETRSHPSAERKFLTGSTLGDLTGDARLAIRERRTKYDPLTGNQCVFLRLLSGVNGVGEGHWVADRVPQEAVVSCGESAMIPLLVEDEASATTSVLAASVRGMAVVGSGSGSAASPSHAQHRPLSPRSGDSAPTPFSPVKAGRGSGGGSERVPLESCASSTLPLGLRVTHYVLRELEKRRMALSDVLCEPRAEAPHDTARANVITDRVRLVSALEVAGVHVTRKESELLHATLEQRVQELRAQAGGDGRLRDARVELRALSASILALDPTSTLLPMAPTSAVREMAALCDELGDARAVEILSPPHIKVAVATAAETSFDHSDAGRLLSLKQMLRVIRSTPGICDHLTQRDAKQLFRALDSDDDGRIHASAIATFVARIATLQQVGRGESSESNLERERGRELERAAAAERERERASADLSGARNDEAGGRLDELRELERRLKAQVELRASCSPSRGTADAAAAPRVATSAEHFQAVEAAVTGWIQGATDATTLRSQLRGESPSPLRGATMHGDEGAAAGGAVEPVQRRLYAAAEATALNQ